MSISKSIFSLLLNLLIISGLIYSRSAGAIQPLESKELALLCENYQAQPDSSESMQCIRYIKGFIDGAIATDGGVAKNAQGDSDKKPSFTERAINTRIGSRIKRYNITVNSDFCLGEPLLIREIVDKVTAELMSSSQPEKLALSVVYKVLRKNYPCEKN
ncbi:Rap1a/Tai family immunity protein [Aliikangiella coralliicola]|uniref:Rap1a immunity protein domain-containing protein n=1 Tax=Aliikangiella coralliicola TaxID=2592383 RepID=A0A545U4C6_9GAMM|nr:Rap1a/Tai family immunity protein [Aliikangiella coralliicola]TQV84330.1 hypothetical protein FLL46_22145 [Aliikangiella coralliicola]